MYSKLKKVFIVFKTHYDIGFTHLVEELISSYSGDAIKKILEVCETTSSNAENRKFVWTMQSWPLLKTIEGVKEPELKKRIEAAIKNEQIIWLNTPFTTHTEFCGVEEFIRGLYISRGLAEEFGKWPEDAKMTDVPGHTRNFPSILSKAGVKFLHLGCNPSCTPPDVPSLFFWEGPDGSRLLTYYSRGAYGTELIPPEDWNYPYWLAMLQTGDNLGPKGADYISEIFKRAENKLPGVEVSIGSLADFGNAILECSIDIPIVKGDLADTWIKGVASAPVGVSKVRAQRPVISNLESAVAFKKLYGIYQTDNEFKKDKSLIQQSYEKTLLFGEHTWGMDCKATILPERYYGAPWDGREYGKERLKHLKNTDPGYIRIQKSWEEQLDYLRLAEKLIYTLKEGSLGDIGDKVDIVGEKVVVFNNLGWKRNAKIVLEGSRYEGVECLEDSETNEKITVYTNNLGDKEANIRNLPALGYKAYKIINKDDNKNLDSERKSSVCTLCGISYIKNNIGILDNEYFRVEIDSITGCIRTFYEKRTKRDWVNKNSKYGFGQYVYDVYSFKEIEKYLIDYSQCLTDWFINDCGKPGYPAGQQHCIFTYGNFEIESSNGYNWGSITISRKITDESVKEYGNAKELKMTVTAYSNEDYIDIRYDLLQKEETALLETGHFAFPFAIDNPKYRINKLGSVIDPVNDILSGCNKDMYCCEKWTGISDGEQGIAVIPLDMPIFSYDEPGTVKFDKYNNPKEATILFQAFNNSWGTNFPQWIGGNLSFRYRILTHNGEWSDGEVWKKAQETTVKLLVSFSQKTASSIKMPCSTDLLADDLDGFVILAFKPAESLDGYILRLSEAAGNPRKAKIKFGIDVKAAYSCDLIERRKDILDVQVSDGHTWIEFDTEPFEIHTFFLKLEPEG